MRLYFAHPVSDYNRPREQKALEAIRMAFPECEIVNPNSDHHSMEYKRVGFRYFEDLAKSCQIVAAMPFPNGEWGMGVWKEAMTMAEVPEGVVLSLDSNGNFTALRPQSIRPLSIDETRRHVREAA